MKKYKQVVISIIADYILWTRVSDGVMNIINAVGGSDQNNFVPDEGYTGYVNALNLLEIENNGLREELCSICNDILIEAKNTPYDELADRIYNEWIVKIADYSIKVA